VIITIVYPIVVGLSSPLRYDTESRELPWLSPLTWWEWDGRGGQNSVCTNYLVLRPAPLHLTDCFVVRHSPGLARRSATLNRNGTDGPRKIDIKPFHFRLEASASGSPGPSRWNLEESEMRSRRSPRRGNHQRMPSQRNTVFDHMCQTGARLSPAVGSKYPYSGDRQRTSSVDLM